MLQLYSNTSVHTYALYAAELDVSVDDNQWQGRKGKLHDLAASTGDIGSDQPGGNWRPGRFAFSSSIFETSRIVLQLGW